jgi:V8-like Glu-specific endopeptidase
MSKLALIAVLSLFVSQAFALPLPKKGMAPQKNFQIENFLTDAYDFEGIVALSNCSGSLIRFENSKVTDQAIVMTNGHCNEYGMPKYGKFMYRKPSNRRFALKNTKSQSTGRLSASEIIYSAMTNTDVTIYKLTDTYADILSKFNIKPLTLSSQHPQVGTAINVISGYWNRGYSCNLEFFSYQLKEDQWTMEDSMRYSRPGCEIIGGTSGSPVIAAGTRTVVGINNTINENGEKCTMDNPCEVDQSGNITYQMGYGYGQETYEIYSCLNTNNEIDLSVPGCKLFH